MYATQHTWPRLSNHPVFSCKYGRRSGIGGQVRPQAGNTRRRKLPFYSGDQHTVRDFRSALVALPQTRRNSRSIKRVKEDPHLWPCSMPASLMLGSLQHLPLDSCHSVLRGWSRPGHYLRSLQMPSLLRYSHVPCLRWPQRRFGQLWTILPRPCLRLVQLRVLL